MGQTESRLKRRIEVSEPEKKVILTKIHEMVRDGTLGQDYTIANRDKNRRLKRDFNINDAKIREILLDLQADD